MAFPQKGALKEGRTILFCDQSGFYLLHTVVRTYAPMGETPTYSLVDASGPDHDRAFVAEIRIGGRLYGRGPGKSKKQAQQQAALQALADIETGVKASG